MTYMWYAWTCIECSIDLYLPLVFSPYDHIRQFIARYNNKMESLFMQGTMKTDISGVFIVCYWFSVTKLRSSPDNTSSHGALIILLPPFFHPTTSYLFYGVYHWLLRVSFLCLSQYFTIISPVLCQRAPRPRSHGMMSRTRNEISPRERWGNGAASTKRRRAETTYHVVPCQMSIGKLI